MLGQGDSVGLSVRRGQMELSVSWAKGIFHFPTTVGEFLMSLAPLVVGLGHDVLLVGHSWFLLPGAVLPSPVSALWEALLQFHQETIGLARVPWLLFRTSQESPSPSLRKEALSG